MLHKLCKYKYMITVSLQLQPDSVCHAKLSKFLEVYVY